MAEALVDWSEYVECGAGNARWLLMAISNGRSNCIASNSGHPSLHHFRHLCLTIIVPLSKPQPPSELYIQIQNPPTI